MKETMLLAGVAGVLVAGLASAGDFAKAIDVEPGGTLHLDLDWRGEVSVTSHEAATVRVEARVHGWPWSVDLDFVREGDDVRLVGEATASDDIVARLFVLALWPFAHAHVDVHAWVPPHYSVEARTRGWRIDVGGVRGSVAVDARGGEVRIHGVAGSVHAETSGGTVDVADVDGEVRAGTGGGTIRLARVSGSIDARTGGGGIDVREAGAGVAAHTGGGSITVAFTGTPAGEIETGSGSIDVRIPPAAGAELDAETAGGSVEVGGDLAVEGRTDARRIVGRLNGGGARLRLRTSGGSIRIAPL